MYLFSSKRNWIIFIFKMSIEMDIFYTNVGNKACHVLGKKILLCESNEYRNFFLCFLNLLFIGELHVTEKMNLKSQPF